MAVVDDRVVQLKFDNKQFESATAATMSTLDKLKKSLDFSSSKKGVDDLSSSMGKFNMGNMATTIEGVSGKFLALATIGVTALSTLTTKAIQVGAQIAKSLTIDPVSSGFKDYELQINAIQTIMANTGLVGQQGLGVVEKTLKDLNEYANLTIYDFSQMTQNIGRFTAAGVGIQQSTDAIKGMSNVAALTGANTEQLGSAMYQMSQALSTGVIRLMDWNSLANANMGTQNMQTALKATARTLGDHGKAMDSAIKKQGNFRDSLTEGWLTSEIFTKTMGIMAGTLDATTGRYRAFTVEELKAKGYTEENAKALTKLSQAAIDSAINIRTFTQMQQALKEGVATAWGDVFKTLFGSIFDATKLFTGMYNVLYNLFTAPIYKLDEFLKVFVKLGGMKSVISGVGNAFKALSSVLDPIKNAFREIFPATTAKQLADMAANMSAFFASLKIGPETAAKLQQTFAGFFAILDIGKQIVGGIFSVFKTLFSTVGQSSGGILDITAKIGNFLVRLDIMLRQGGQIKDFFTIMGNALKVPVELLQKLGTWLAAAFAGKDAVIGATGDAIGRVADRLSPFGNLLSVLTGAWDRFLGILNTLSPFFASMLQQFSQAFAKIPQIIQQSVQSGDYSAMLDTINTAIFGGIALMFRKFLKGGGANLGGGLVSSITKTFGELTNTLKAMQTQLKAKALMEIAIAVGVLTASVVALSMIPSAKLTTALVGLGAVFTELMVAMKVLDKMSSSAGFIKLPIIAGSLILLSTAILILTGAVLLLSTMSWEQMTKGLTALTVILGVLDVATKPLAASSPGLVIASAALVLLGGALLIIAGAMAIFATMSWESLGKGLAGVAGALAVIATTMNLMPPTMIVQAAAIVLVATAMDVLAGAMAIFAKMSWEQIGKGLAAVLGSLAAIGVAMAIMPGPMMVVTAAGLILVAIALNGIAGAMKIMASMSWEEIAKGLVGIAGALLILAGGLYLMTGTIAGSAALLIAAGALLMLTPVLQTLGNMSWESIGKGLLALAGAFAVIGVAALLLTPVIPSMLGLAAAIALLGAGMMLIGVGVLAFATAITMLVAVGSMGVVALTAILQTVIGIIPTVMKALELALVAFAQAIIAAAPAIITAITVVLTGLLNMVIKMTPTIVRTLSVLLDALIYMCVKYIPKLVDAGMKIAIGVLDGITKNLPKLLKAGADLIIAFIKGIGDQSLRIIKAAGETLITFLNGLTTWINTNSGRLNKAGEDLVKAIIKGMVSGIASGASGVVGAISEMAGNAIDAAKKVLHINSPSKVFIAIGKSVNEGFVNGIVSGKADVQKSLTSISDAIKKAKDDSAAHIVALQKKVATQSARPKTAANTKALAATKAELATAILEQKKLSAAYKTISVQRKSSEAALVSLGAQYDAITAKLDDAKQKYADAIKARDDFAKSITDKYSVLPTIDATTSLDEYFDAIRQATADNLKFKATLEQLRKIGLDDVSYKKFLDQGVAAQPFLDQLLASGGSTVAELNKIDSTLAESATSLGKTASEALYQAGVDSAKGLVDGLTSQMTAISDKMKTIGKMIADEIKKELGIKSPSTVFAEIGANSLKGFAKGIEANTNVIDMSARRAGQIAVESLKKSMGGISEAVSSEIDIQPTIAPVLDLTAFRKDASAMSDILKAKPLETSVSVQNASATNGAVEATKAALEASAALQQTGTTVELTQYNNSPKALSSAEIYRQTKNQLSIVKEALPK